MKTDGAILGQVVDLTNCDREPIHVPGYIQPHGVLIVLSESLCIDRISENAGDHFLQSASELLGSSLKDLLSPESYSEITPHLLSSEPDRANPLRITIGDKTYDAIAHRHLDELILELEPASGGGEIAVQIYHLMRKTMTRFRSSRDLGELCQTAATEMRRITGFDRVVIYRFDREWNGVVLAEDKIPEADSYMGLHFPASDIPRQARQLYEKNWIRVIPEVNYKPARILSQPTLPTPLDLTFSVLRSVSPIHIEYLNNMKVSASMSVSLMIENKLWGLVSCTHTARSGGTKYIPFEIRAACQMIGELMSSLLSAKEDAETSEYRIRLKSVHACLLQYMSQTPDLIHGLVGKSPNLLDQVNARGAAIYFDGEYTMIGETPTNEQVADLVKWLAERQDQVICTESLPTLYPEARAYKDVGCGLMALSLSRGRNNYLLWFRPEVVQTVNWSGNPSKPVESGHQNQGMRIHPRKSFELWKEIVRDRALPWLEVEKQAAMDLRESMIDIILQKAEEISKLNVELERSNIELDSFAYAASHDLKEPLRGIHNYANLVLRQAGEMLDEKSGERMHTIVRLTQRMEALINSLLYYSQVGRMDLSMRESDLNEVLTHVIDGIRHRIEAEKVEIRVPKQLPVVKCDKVRIAEVFANLITNSIKYNERSEKWVEIGFKERNGAPEFHVRDNGIGIRERHYDSVFRIFKRLHGRDEFGGGTGTGLTITRRIIERHNGKIWLESVVGEGTTFHFTLGEHPLES